MISQKSIYWFLVGTIFLLACKTQTKKEAIFKVLTEKETGIQFANKLTPTPQFNMFKYMYFYNGAGVGAGDFNNDGLTDLFFASNQQANKLFLNKGNLQFTDVTNAAKIPNDSAWNTGVSVADVNADGMLDLYISRVSGFENLHGKNQLLICTGIDKAGVPTYADSAAAYGIDFVGFSTQAVFFDYDLDGDLDMYLLNHSVHQNGTFAERKNFIGTFHPQSGDRLFKNIGNKFIDVTKESKINSSAIGYGLGICVADINVDGWPDLYIGNDFHENDYLYINQHDGTFKETSGEQMMHTSQFSMGVDVADINNDKLPEIISMDMLPSDPYILKRSLGEDEYNTFHMKIGYGYNYQFTRNNLQLNRGNGLYSETGLYSGVAATDWSWACLWMDFDNDGMKDLFISNGIPKRLNDIDYVAFVGNDEVQQKMNAGKLDEKDMAVIDGFPQIKIPNKFYKNLGDAKFEDVEQQIEGDLPTFSNGSVYADLDNDGDLDVVVNNVDANALIYANKTNDNKKQNFLQLHLQGNAANRNAIGSRLLVFADSGGVRTYEKNPVHGFLSSMENDLLVGLEKTKVDSMLLIWPDGSFEKLNWQSGNGKLNLTYKTGLPKFDFTSFLQSKKETAFSFADITQQTGLQWKHEENLFNEFDREPLIPHMCSREGPALATADINGDGLDDIFVGSSKGTKAAVFTQTTTGKFVQMKQPALQNDSTFEEVDAAWTDVNNDKNLDLVVAEGGNEYYGKSEFLAPQIYLNDGKGLLTKMSNPFDSLYVNASCIALCDVNADGWMDLFIGGRTVPWEYGQVPNSYLLLNNGKGKFENATKNLADELTNIGFVTHAEWVDLDKNGDKDLLLSLEWGGIVAMMNEKGKLTKKELTDRKGWWNFAKAIDVDADGDLDIVAGNLGLNSRLHASDDEPVRLYYNDFDGNGKKEQVLTYYLQGKEIPFANKDEIQRQIPLIKKKYLYAGDFAKATLSEIFGSDKLSNASVLAANYFSNAVLINDGKMNFTTTAMPWLAQLSPYRDAISLMDEKQKPQVLLTGNFYENNIEMGRYDADFGILLSSNGNGLYNANNLPGLNVKGEARCVREIKMQNGNALVIAFCNDSLRIVSFKK